MGVQTMVEPTAPKAQEIQAVRPVVSTKSLKVTALDRLMIAPIEVRVRPKPVLRNPILPLIVQKDVEAERKALKNKTIRLLLLAS